MERRTKLIAAGTAGAALILVGSGVIVTSGSSVAEEQTAVAATSTAQVERRTLTAAETRDGTVGFADATTLRTQSQGVLTAIAPAGSTKRRGDVLYRINQNPTVLIYGEVPAYRALSEGMSGRDVKQLERNLKALGYRGFTVDRSFTSGTAEAVRKWQDKLDVAQTGSLSLGDVCFQPTAVRMGAAAADIGENLQPGAAVAEISSADEAVTVSLDEGDADLAAVGDVVGVGTGMGTGSADARGKVTAVDAVSTSAQDGSTTTTYDVTVTLSDKDADAIERLPEGASVDVDFGSDTVTDVLAVPVKALLALAEGGSGVELATSGGNAIVAVKTGTFADGWVEVTSDEIAEGDQVVVAP